MDKAEEREAEIYREFDYSNSIPEIQVVSLLIQYCDFYYKQLIKLCKEDAIKQAKIVDKRRWRKKWKAKIRI